MGYGVMAYRVDIDKLSALCGSGDNQMRRVICGRFRTDIARLNDDLDCSNDRGAPSVFTAIEHLVMGGDKTLPGHLYGYGFKYMVEFSGRFLNNEHFYPCPSSYLDSTVDPALKATGAGITMSDLIFRGAPVDFPSPDDFPAIGYWTADEVAAAAEPLRAGTTDEVRAIAAWTADAAAERKGIVGFYH
ncbi:hypothetical protein AB0K00_30225 [Dactylosporangium sp. NPDC049525]|uniref:DUF7691 family protein n=1 Tax=Dactylosporangium sp. NPDC049525 TaxID=3154730 RepID=UPI003431C140